MSLGETVTWAEMVEAWKTKPHAKNSTLSWKSCLQNFGKLWYWSWYLGLCVCLLLQSLVCVNKYNQEPTFVETIIVPQHKLTFPAISLCSGEAGYKSEVLEVTF